MRIGILGGSFDPPHQGHLYIAKLALQKLRLQQIWVVPTAQNPLKKKSAISYQARIGKCQEVFKNNPQIRVKDFERYSYFAYDLVKKLRAQYPRHHFVWVMGDDNLRDFHKWKKVRELVRMVDFAVFARSVPAITNEQEKIANKRRAKKFCFFNTKKYDISSTELRKHN